MNTDRKRALAVNAVLKKKNQYSDIYRYFKKRYNIDFLANNIDTLPSSYCTEKCTIDSKPKCSKCTLFSTNVH